VSLKVTYGKTLTISDLAAMLGTTKRIECPDSDAFQDEIVRYIGSRAQNHQMSSENAEPLPEMWPLITKVVVYCDAKVLSTGASFVDLAGKLHLTSLSPTLIFTSRRG
jgi:hypothetical protein